MAEKRKSCRERTLELMAIPEKGKFPYFIDSQQPHKIGHAQKVTTSTGSLTKVQCKCGSPQWITTARFKKRKMCFICGAKRVEIQKV